jgi:hypothetical protein
MAAAAAILILGMGCASPKPGLGGEFPEGSAIRVEIDNDVLLVDGSPVARDGLAASIDAAFKSKGIQGRRAALLTARFKVNPNETILSFERRKQETMEEVQSALIAAGVRDLHIGPVARDGDRPKEAPKEPPKKEPLQP